MRSNILFISVIVILAAMCDHTGSLSVDEINTTTPQHYIMITATPAKWFNRHRSAVSVTIDIAAAECGNLAQEVVDRSLTVDIEMTTAGHYTGDKPHFRTIESLYAHGIRFFGHGHEHLNHDTMSYSAAFANIVKCFHLMTKWNLTPLAYGYPYGTGRKATTQQAVSDAGFICARGVCLSIDSLYICPDDRSVPENWFFLPAVCIARNVPGWISNHDGMEELFNTNQQKQSWLIPMYHSIGYKNELAYYPLEDFRKDLDYLCSSDIWVANMDVVARYILERNSCRMSYNIVGGTDDDIFVEIVFEDSLDATVSPVPLTMVLGVIGDRSINRCEVTDAGGAHTVYQVANEQFTMNILPDGATMHMRFYWSDDGGP